VNGETVEVLGGTLAFVRGTGESVGSYLITPGGLTSSNYALTFNTGGLSITPAPLSVTADSKSKIAGTADPAFTVTYNGFVNGETSLALGGTLVFSRAPGEGAGSYAINPSGLTSTNYAITFEAGALTITAPANVILPLALTQTNVVITWTAISNATYRVQYKTDLNAAAWTDLIGDVLSTGSTASTTDIRTAAQRFYRVQVLP